MSTIAIINYGAGNLGSVCKAFDYLDINYRVVDQADQIGEPDGLVLPGVGAFGAAMEKLQSSGFVPVIKNYINSGRPFLGICLGMQLLMDSSDETEGVRGLGIIPGTCKRFSSGKVPQIGWNRIQIPPDTQLFRNIPTETSFYFIHSYYIQETERSAAAAETHYHIPFVSALEKNNIYAVQFHPEKSGPIGLQVLQNWTQIVRKTTKSFVGGPGGRFYKRAPLAAAGGTNLSIRIIPCLDVDNGRVVKGIQFKDIQDAGDPVQLAKRYNQAGADEITFLDIGATHKSRQTLLNIVTQVSREVFVPLTVGGGIAGVDHMRSALKSGADKVSICSAALRNPQLITDGARIFGSQCIVLSIDAGRVGNQWHAFLRGGREDSGIDALEWAKQGEALGAGEILLNSIDRDGTQAGYDLELTRLVSESVNIPVIGSGGAGSMEHMVQVVEEGKADAVLLASLLHHQQLELQDIKQYLNKKGVNVRWSSQA